MTMIGGRGGPAGGELGPSTPQIPFENRWQNIADDYRKHITAFKEYKSYKLIPVIVKPSSDLR